MSVRTHRMQRQDALASASSPFEIPSRTYQRRNMKKLGLSVAMLTLLAVGILAGCSKTTASPDVADSIRKSLDQAGLKSVAVSQDRDKGIVTLSGQVASENDKLQAETLAKSYAGTQVVANQPEPPGHESSPSDSRPWEESLSDLEEQWDRHEERWPQEQRPQIDRSNDEPGSWRGEGDQYLDAEENLVAGHALERIRPIEEKVSAMLHEIKTEVPGCDLVGLKFSLKGEERFKEKVSDELRAKPDRPIAEITERMPDAIRYTFQLDADRYVTGYWNLREHLELSGSELLISRNSWDSPDYKGANTRWLGPDGQVFEVQFHTPESYQAKQLTHTAYERLRTGIAPGAERPELEDFQQDVSACIPVPDGSTGIPDYRREGY